LTLLVVTIVLLLLLMLLLMQVLPMLQSRKGDRAMLSDQATVQG
jgi:hypothetical protein